MATTSPALTPAGGHFRRSKGGMNLSLVKDPARIRKPLSATSDRAVRPQVAMGEGNRSGALTLPDLVICDDLTA